MYYVFIGIIVLLAIVVGTLVYRIKGNNKEEYPGNLLISSGIGLIISAFPGVSDTLINIIVIWIKVEISSNKYEMYIRIICGFALIILGFLYGKNIKDRFYVLNLFSKDKIYIGQEPNSKDLGLVDFKIREHTVDIIRAFNEGRNISPTICKYIVEEIKEKCECFMNQSKEWNKGFTGMAPIPFTILAGTFIAGTEINRYFEYDKFKKRFYELKRKKFSRKFAELIIDEAVNKTDSTDVIVTVGITREPLDSDLVQFGTMDTVSIGLQEPNDNVIKYKEQLDSYTEQIIRELEKLTSSYPNLERIHLVAVIPSCVSIELGRLIEKDRNRLPKIISYHYIRDNEPRYAFGVVVTEDEKGKLIV